jgi:hypothetical protein
MGYQNPGSLDPMAGSQLSSGPEIDYSPRKNTRAETLLYGGKFLAVSGTVLILFNYTSQIKGEKSWGGNFGNAMTIKTPLKSNCPNLRRYPRG